MVDFLDSDFFLDLDGVFFFEGDFLDLDFDGVLFLTV